MLSISSAGRISVVVPTFNEAERLPQLLGTLVGQPELREIIVADGGSTDGTTVIAEQLGALVVSAKHGRGGGLRAGAAAGKGEILLFLHADSIFPAGGLGAIVAALDRNPSIPGGNFRVIFDVDTLFARVLSAVYARIRYFALYYGDSGIFVRREVYDAIGGIKAMPVMEDYEFVRRLERAGPTCRIDDPPLVTSSRRFSNRRRAAALWIWIKIHLLYWFGVSTERLARMYVRNQERAVQRTSIKR
jgi:rSAM/selenodomain-associated transferase 2